MLVCKERIGDLRSRRIATSKTIAAGTVHDWRWENHASRKMKIVTIKTKSRYWTNWGGGVVVITGSGR